MVRETVKTIYETPGGHLDFRFIFSYSGFVFINADGGALFLILPSFEIDVELGQRISGNLNGIDHYIGTGMAVLIG